MTTLLIVLAVLIFMGIPALLFIAACIAGARASQRQEEFISYLEVPASQEPVPDWMVIGEKAELRP